MRYRIRVIGVGRSACAWADAAVADYTRRIRRHGKLEELSVKPEPFRGDVDAVRAAEGARLRKAADRDVLVALDERGDRLDTAAFAELLGGLALDGQVGFAIGGAYGLDASVRDAARRTVRLSDLVLNHEVARVVLYEQLYRAIAIREGIPYHH